MDRCMAVTGTARMGPTYCGNPAKGADANGRPVCGVHKKGQVEIPWSVYASYPHGDGGRWKFANGDPR